MRKVFSLVVALLACTLSVFAQQAVSGIVVDTNGDPIIGATISEVGTTIGTISDFDGQFTLQVAKDASLKISYVGYKAVTLKAVEGMRVVLQEDNTILDELVVVGYGVQKKANLTGAVSSVDIGKTLGSRPESDVSKALQGSVPGLSVLSNSGDLNSNPRLSIRGIGTLSNGAASEPLIVVDGVPTDDLSMINSDDIASISVLKDASSVAIYGTRAAFGVILITTKQGKRGEHIRVNYSNNFAWDRATMLPDFPDVPTQLKSALIAKNRAGSASCELFGMEFKWVYPYAVAWQEQHNGKKTYSEMQPFQSMSDVGDYYHNGPEFPFLYYADYDVNKIFYNDAAPSQTHNVSLNGSTEHTTYYASFGYSNKEDLMNFNPAKRQRYNASLNLTADVTKWLTVGARFNFSRREYDRAEPYANIPGTIYRWGSFFVPSGYIVDENGEAIDFRMVAFQKQADRRVSVRDQIRMNVFAKAQLYKGLTLNADFTYTIDNINMRSTVAYVYGYNWNGTTPTTLVSQNNTGTQRWNTKANTWNTNAYLEYDNTWSGHHFKGMIGMMAEKRNFNQFTAYKKSLYSMLYPELNFTYGDPSTWSISGATSGYTADAPYLRGEYATAGYFARFNYDYRDIYLVEVNGRYDGSSSFPGSKRWAFFPSVSAGYRFSEEGYFEKAKDVVSNGKLRASFGEVGNEAVGDAMYLATISQTTLNYLDNSGTKLNTFNMPSWVASELSWERIRTTNVGLDLGFLNNQINISGEWFQRETLDMLAPGSALPSSAGASAPYTNNGTLRSRGWELTIDAHRQFTKDVYAYANFSIGDSRVKVTKWNNEAQLIGHPMNTSYAYEGMYWGDIWGFETDRYFTEADFNGQNADGSWNYLPTTPDQTGIQTDNFVYGPGDIKFKDLNGDGKIDGGAGTAVDHGDLKVIGNMLPRYEYSFHLGGVFYGVDIDLFFQGVGKRDMWTTSSFAFPEMRDADVAIFAHQTDYNVYGTDPITGEFVNNISESNFYPCLYSGSNDAGNVEGLKGEYGCHNYYPQTKYLVDMSYLRLKNVTIGYTLPQKWSRKAYIEKFRIYFSGNNLALLHNGSHLPIDPEITYDYRNNPSMNDVTLGRTSPITGSYSFGFQVTF